MPTMSSPMIRTSSRVPSPVAPEINSGVLPAAQTSLMQLAQQGVPLKAVAAMTQLIEYERDLGRADAAYYEELLVRIDEARAAVAALDWPSGAVNIVDDEPAPARDWLPVLADALGAPVSPCRHRAGRPPVSSR